MFGPIMLKEGLNFPFPAGKQGKVVPFFWPRGFRAPHCQAHWKVFESSAHYVNNGEIQSSNMQTSLLKQFPLVYCNLPNQCTEVQCREVQVSAV